MLLSIGFRMINDTVPPSVEVVSIYTLTPSLACSTCFYVDIAHICIFSVEVQRDAYLDISQRAQFTMSKINFWIPPKTILQSKFFTSANGNNMHPFVQARKLGSILDASIFFISRITISKSLASVSSLAKLGSHYLPHGGAVVIKWGTLGESTPLAFWHMSEDQN